jgi:hypothetical protein
MIERTIFSPTKREDEKRNGVAGVPGGHINSARRFFAGKALERQDPIECVIYLKEEKTALKSVWDF